MDQQNTEQSQSQVNLTLADLTLALQSIQLAASRGAFRAEEFTEIGGCYTRIFSFLEASGAIKKDESADAEQPAEQNS